MNGRLALVTVGILAVILCVGGCSADVPGYDRERIDFLNSTVDEVAPEDYGEVICDIGGGETGLGKGFDRQVLLKGTAGWEGVSQRLKDLGYSGVVVDDHFTFGRSDGIVVEGGLITAPGSYPFIETTLEDLGCTVPTEGAVSLYFNENQGGIAE